MTRKDAWALFVMGVWTMGSVCVSIVATENFYTIDRLLESSTNVHFYGIVQQIGHSAARDLLRYLSSELNRLYFQFWNIAQLGLAAAALWLAGRSPRIRAGLLAMLAIVVLMLVYLMPQIVALGRRLDFVPRETPPPGMQRFWILHAAYTSLEMLKLILGVIVAWWMMAAKGLEGRR